MARDEMVEDEVDINRRFAHNSRSQTVLKFIQLFDEPISKRRS